MKKSTEHGLLVICLIILTTAVLIWLIRQNKSEVVQGEYPVSQYERSERRDGRKFLTIRASDNVKAKELVDMSYFEPLSFSTTQREAVDLLGLPTNTRADSNTKIMEFQRDSYRLEVHLVDTGGASDEFMLYSYPEGRNVNDILSKHVTRLIDPEVEKSTITISLANEQTIFITTEGRRVMYMQWRGY